MTPPTTNAARKAAMLKKFGRKRGVKAVKAPASKASASKPPRAKTPKAPASKAPRAKTPASKAPRATAARSSDERDAWLWAAYAALQAEAEHAQAWDDPMVPDFVRALLLRYCKGSEAFGVWSMNKVPPQPTWFTTWSAEFSQLQQLVDAQAMTWSELEASCKVGEEVRLSCNLYQLEIVLDPNHALYQTRGLPPRNAVERRALRTLQATIDRLGQLDPLHVIPERGSRPGPRAELQARLLINAGRQRTKALRQHNLDVIAAWWKPLTWLSVTRAPPPTLRLEVPCIISRRPIRRALEESAALNATPRRPSKIEMLEEAVRLKANGVGIVEIGEVMGGIGKSSVHNLLSLERLDPTLLSLVWAETLPLACAYELVRHPKERQVQLWTAAANESDKLHALKQLLASAEAGAPAVTPRPRLSVQNLRTASEPLRTQPEFAGHVDLVDALLGDAEARARLPEALQAFVAAALGGARPHSGLLSTRTGKDSQ